MDPAHSGELRPAWIWVGGVRASVIYLNQSLPVNASLGVVRGGGTCTEACGLGTSLNATK